jgi:hypothetical protein
MVISLLFQVEEERMGVFRQHERRGFVERRSLGTIPFSCSGAWWTFYLGPLAAKSEEGARGLGRGRKRGPQRQVFVAGVQSEPDGYSSR